MDLAANMSMDDPIEALIERLNLAVPSNIRAFKQWLVWRFEPAREPGGKPLKVPYYVNGSRRQGQQGSLPDRAALVVFDEALAALRCGKWTGLGFAFVPGSTVNAGDFDNCVDHGSIVPEVAQFMHATESYAELSPSGNGVRSLFFSDLASAKHIDPDGYNVEVFGESGFVTITGNILTGNDVGVLPPECRTTLLRWVANDSNERARARGEQLEQVKATDPIYQRLRAAGSIKREFADGRVGIACPFEEEHSSGSGESDTVYFPPNTLGYARGHFKCLHAHCAQRTDADFASKLGIGFLDVSGILGDKGPIVNALEFTNAWRPTEYVVKGLLQRGHLVSLTGHSNAGKTALALRMAVCVALGAPFGRHKAQQGRVVYLAGENADDIRCRLIAIAQDLQVSLESLAATLYIVPLAFPIAQHVATLKTELDKLGELALVIVDTRAAYASAQDENDNMQALVDARAIREVMAAKGKPAALVLNHPPHRAEIENLKPRGGSAYWGELDSNMTAWNDGSGNITLHWNKIRGQPWEPVNLTLRPYTLAGFAQPDGDPVQSIIADVVSDEQAEGIEEQTRSDEDSLLLAIKASPNGTLRTWADSIGWKGGKNKAGRLLAQLKHDGLVRMYRRQWTLTKKGEDEAAEAMISGLK